MSCKYRQAFVIYNPCAGQIRRRPATLAECFEELRSTCDVLTPIATSGPGSATEIAKQCIEQGADVILVAGGDGTVNEVVNGLATSAVPLGVLPAGTANGLAAEIGIRKEMLSAARDLPRWVPKRISLGLQSGVSGGSRRFFLLLCGIGLDALVIYKLHPGLKNALGKTAFVLTGFSLLGRRLPRFRVVADKQVHHGTLAAVTRIRNYGGDLNLARSVSLLDNFFEVVIFPGESSWSYLRYLLAFVFGSVHNMPEVVFVSARSVAAAPEASKPVYCQLDGERAGCIPVSLEIVEDSLTLLLPPEYPRTRRPSLEMT